MEKIPNINNVQKDELLDILCNHYNDLKAMCSDYDMCLPESGDLGEIKNYLSENLDRILICLEHCYYGEIVKKVKNVVRKESYYG